MAGSPLLRILNTTTSMLFGRVMELSIKYPQSIMIVVFGIRNKGNRLFHIGKVYSMKSKVDFLHGLPSPSQNSCMTHLFLDIFFR